ncbi:MAG TPA: serine/threonine-protein kinase [Terriglobales bacterium]|nr:serine/threonine-protein kinase [Terriglobales bacterium]
MRISDTAIERLRAAAEFPDLSGTRYRLMDKLGQGGMGAVYRVEDSVLERQIALKVINILDDQNQLAARLLQEARVIARLEHPGIVPVHDVGTLPDGRVFYTMKLVQGRRLDDPETALGGESECLRSFLKICEAVAFAHAHDIVHRDLKPSNIMIGPFGEVLVMDWGLAKVLGSSHHRDNAGPDDAVVGTPGFMAPEQERGDSHVGPLADVYSLGTILKFLLKQRAAEPVSRRLTAIVRKATEAASAARYASVQELASDITQYLQGGAVAAFPEGPGARAWRWIVKNRAWILLILAYLVTRTLFILWRRFS